MASPGKHLFWTHMQITYEICCSQSQHSLVQSTILPSLSLSLTANHSLFFSSPFSISFSYLHLSLSLSLCLAISCYFSRATQQSLWSQTKGWIIELAYREMVCVMHVSAGGAEGSKYWHVILPLSLLFAQFLLFFLSHSLSPSLSLSPTLSHSLSSSFSHTL